MTFNAKVLYNTSQDIAKKNLENYIIRAAERGKTSVKIRNSYYNTLEKNHIIPVDLTYLKDLGFKVETFSEGLFCKDSVVIITWLGE